MHSIETHTEHHFTSGRTLRELILGVCDGLTVPFAIAAGLSGVAASNGIIVAAGFAEIVAGAISMGLGGYMAAKGDAEHYVNEYRRESKEVREIPERERQEVRDIFKQYRLQDDEIEPILNSFQRHPEDWIDFMMRFELGLEKPEPRRALHSAGTIGGAYAAGGMIPLSPYLAHQPMRVALVLSSVATLSALFVFGFIKARLIGKSGFAGAVQMLVVGGLSAMTAFALARLVVH